MWKQSPPGCRLLTGKKNFTLKLLINHRKIILGESVLSIFCLNIIKNVVSDDLFLPSQSSVSQLCLCTVVIRVLCFLFWIEYILCMHLRGKTNCANTLLTLIDLAQLGICFSIVNIISKFLILIFHCYVIK